MFYRTGRRIEIRRKPALKKGGPDSQREHFLSLSKDAAKRLGTASLAWGLTLAVTFFLVNDEVAKRIGAVSQNRAEQLSMDNAIRLTLKDARDEQAKQTDEIKREASRRQATQKVIGFQAKKDELKKNESSFGAPIEFSLPGLPKIQVSPTAAPAAWLVLSALVLSHLCTLRRHAHGYLSLALSRTPAKERGLPVAAPFRLLLAPVPNRDGLEVSSNQYAATYGVGARYRETALAALLLACLLLGQMRMLWMQHVLSSHVREPWLPQMLQLASIALLGATLVMCWHWLKPWRVPDADFLPAGHNAAHRREAIALAVGGIAAIGVSALPSPVSSKELRKGGQNLLAVLSVSPRRRIKRSLSDVLLNAPDGLVVNKRSRVAHLVISSRLTGVQSSRVKESNFQSLPLSSFLKSMKTSALRLPGRLAPFIADQVLGLRSSTGHSRVLHETRSPSSPSQILDEQFQMLMAAIRSDLAYKQRAGLKARTTGSRSNARRRHKSWRSWLKRFRRSEAPLPQQSRSVPRVAIHLYDRAASIAAAAGRRDLIDALVANMRANNLDGLYRTRIEKWGDPTSRWWSSRRVPDSASRPSLS